MGDEADHMEEGGYPKPRMGGPRDYPMDRGPRDYEGHGDRGRGGYGRARGGYDGGRGGFVSSISICAMVAIVTQRLDVIPDINHSYW